MKDSIDDIELDILLITRFEKTYIEKSGHWESSRIENIKRQIEHNREKEKQKIYVDKMFPIYEKATFSYEHKIILEKWEDIFNIFAKKELKDSFMTFLVKRMITENIFDNTPFYFNDQSYAYVVDYRFLIKSFYIWGVEILKFENEKFANICRWFVPNIKGNNAKACHSFVEIFLNSTEKIVATNFKDEYFFNAAIVKNKITEKQMFFMGVPLMHTQLMYILERELYIKLMKKRQISNIYQIAFGKIASSFDVEQFYILSL